MRQWRTGESLNSRKALDVDVAAINRILEGGTLAPGHYINMEYPSDGWKSKIAEECLCDGSRFLPIYLLKVFEWPGC